jgi:hypothetical protein
MRRAESRCEKALFYRLFTSAGDRRAGSRGADVSGPFLYPTTLRDGHRGTSPNRAPPATRRTRGPITKTIVKSGFFRITSRDSLIARVLHSRLQKLGNVANAIWDNAFSRDSGMHAPCAMHARFCEEPLIFLSGANLTLHGTEFYSRFGTVRALRSPTVKALP